MRTTSITRPKFEPNGTLCFEKITTTQAKDIENNVWKTTERKVERLTIESQGYIRELSTSLVIIRKAVMSDMKEHTGFFQQKILVKIDLTNYGHDYDFSYLRKSSRGHITVTNFEPEFSNTQTISLNDERFVHKVGKAKRISELEAKTLLIKHEALALVDEQKNPETMQEEFRINL